ncbi:MAG: MATE family efflux transporter [Lachnospiraceae bacterium]|nr:MATE family efflux transporter [Lachnospiraceae bacterium]
MAVDVRDMTKGPLGKQILVFSIPLILSNVLQVLFNLADVAVVGRFAGSMALGSVGSTITLVTMFTGFLIGIASGINVLVAMYFGAGNKKGVEETVHSAALFSVMIGVLILLFGVTCSKRILLILNTKQELIDGAVQYVSIYFLGMPALAVYNFGNAVFSAVGDTARPLRYLTIAGVLNLVLNLLFVVGCHMGVAGVAAASAISQYSSAVMIVSALFCTGECYGLRFGAFHWKWEAVKDIARIGLPAGLQNAIFQLANLFIQAGVNTFSAVMVAGNSAATNADALVYDVMAAFYTACGSFMGQNYGAGNKKRIRNSYFISLGYSFGIGLVLGLLLVIFGESFLALFTSDQEVIRSGMYRLTIMGLSYGVSAFMDCTIAASRALGKGVIPTVIVVMGSCVLRIIWVYTVFAYFKTIPSLYLLYVCSWSVTAIAEITYFARIYRQKMKEMLP